jgi:glycosyltransferase involved in cell wall biosynthesis
MRGSTISAVVRAYNAEDYIGESVRAILEQTRPADEVIVVDDGSTDGTAQELRRFESEIRVVWQENAGHVAAMNRCFEEARGQFVAICDADDVWKPEKLERQDRALRGHPEVDIAFGAAEWLGLDSGPRPSYPGAGVIAHRQAVKRLFRANSICTSSVAIRRSLQRRLGPFIAGLPCEDYEYWLRALEAGAVLYSDPQTLVGYRRCDQSVSSDKLAMHRAELAVHTMHAGLPARSGCAEKTIARDLRNIARELRDQGDTEQARAVFRVSLTHRTSVQALAWIAVLSTPERVREGLGSRLITVKRAMHPSA